MLCARESQQCILRNISNYNKNVEITILKDKALF